MTAAHPFPLLTCSQTSVIQVQHCAARVWHADGGVAQGLVVAWQGVFTCVYAAPHVIMLHQVCCLCRTLHGECNYLLSLVQLVIGRLRWFLCGGCMWAPAGSMQQAWPWYDYLGCLGCMCCMVNNLCSPYGQTCSCLEWNPAYVSTCSDQFIEVIRAKHLACTLHGISMCFLWAT